MKRQLAFLARLLVIIMTTTAIGYAADIQDIRLSVTVRQKEANVLSKGLHLIELVCFQRDCSLTSLSLNQCVSGPEAAFYPKIERTSTRDGNLTVSFNKNTIYLQERGTDIGGEYVAQFKIGYRRTGDKLHNAAVTSLTGGYIKQSEITQETYSVEFVPLETNFQKIQLDCPVLLPGIVK